MFTEVARGEICRISETVSFLVIFFLEMDFVLLSATPRRINSPRRDYLFNKEPGFNIDILGLFEEQLPEQPW